MVESKKGFARTAGARMRRQDVIWLTTVDRTGAPQPRPVWFHWDGASVLIFSQGKAAKVSQIRGNPKVSLNLNSDPEGEQVTVLLGTARILPTWPEERRVRAYVRKYREGIEGLGMTPEAFKNEYSTPIEIIPRAVRGF